MSVAQRFLLLLLLAFFSSATANAQESVSLPVDPAAIIDQHLYTDSENACGPAAVANSLVFGTEPMRQAWGNFVGGDDRTRLRFLVDRWFRSRASLEFPTKKRLAIDGVLEEDLAAACAEMSRDLRLPLLQGTYLDRLAGEKSPAFLARVHEALLESVENGVPPILSLKSYVARRLERLDGGVGWMVAEHHCVVVTGVRSSLRPGDLGFSVDLIDPNGGYQTSAFIYAENQLNFRALKGSEGNGKWLSGRPYLLVQAPGVLSIRPDKAEWQDRIIVTANYLIGDF